jgi:hypothetical protein
MANLKGILDSIRKIMWTDTGLNGICPAITGNQSVIRTCIG